VSVYIDGSQAGNYTIPNGAHVRRLCRVSWPAIESTNYIGRNYDSTSFFSGYLDEFQLFATEVPDSIILDTYQVGAANLQMEFDEGAEAASFDDRSDNDYDGTPAHSYTCATFSLDNLLVNSASQGESPFYVTLDDTRIFYDGAAAVGSSHALSESVTLCDQGTLVAGVGDGQTGTTLGSVTLNPAVAGGGSQTFSSGPESVTLNWTIAADQFTQYNPLPGLVGRIANGLTLDGSSYLNLGSAAAINSLTNNLSIMGWVKPDAPNGWQRILAPARTNSNDGISLALHDNDLVLTAHGVQQYTSSSTVLTTGIWQHVAAVMDANNDVHYYINGNLVDTVSGSSPAVANSDDPLYIGATTGVGNTNLAQSGSTQKCGVKTGLEANLS